ncbi:MAG: CPBP family intramembrane metalloprotease [Rhodobacterales bacterium]
MFPKTGQKFQQFYKPAIATRSIGRLLMGVVVLSILYIVFYIIFFAIIGIYFGFTGALNGFDLVAIRMKFGTVFLGNSPESVVLVLLSFTAMFLSVLATVKWVYKRGLSSLFGPDIGDVFRGFKGGFLFIIAVSFVSIGLFSIINTPVKNLEFSTWIKWVWLAIPLIFLQTTSEELIFRGYLQQQLAARFNSRWAWYFLPSLAFGMLHYDPGTMGSNAWILVLHTTLFGLIAAEVTARTGNLGTAMGLHFANNLLALGVVTMDGPLSGLGLYKTAISVSDEVAIRPMMLSDLILTALLYGLYLLWCKKHPEL